MGPLAVGRREVIHAALDIRTALQLPLLAPRRFADFIHLEHLARIVLDWLAGLGIDAIGPIDFLRVLLGRDELPVVAVQPIEEAVAAEMGDDLAILAVHLRVDQLIDPDLVIIEEIAGGILEVPDHLAIGGVEPDRRVGEEVVARAVFRIEHRDRLAGAPDRQLGRWIIRAGYPEGAAPMLPGIGVAFPGLTAGLARCGNRISPPEPLAGIRVQRVDMGAGALVAAAAADDELVVDQKRSRRQCAVGLLGIIELDRPDEFAGVGLGPQDLAIGRDRNDKVLIERDATVRSNRIHDPGDSGLGRFPDVYPVDCAKPVDDEHRAVVDERCALMAPQRDFAQTLNAAKRHRESDAEILDVILVDLVELGIAMRGIVLIDHQPVLRLLIGVQQPRRRYLPRHRRERRPNKHG